ncbi:S-adenosyl-L-methionine-dependent methyltransferase [Nemania sp. FL0916]|nr:S-adenosyl-L-methionine-dependent methyltransferase [Nemania sp. FL0916]
MSDDNDTSAPVPVPTDLKDRLKASYDAMASTYNSWTLPNSQQRIEYLDKALAELSPPQPHNPSFLELGCGCGLPATAKLLSLPRARVIANDLSDTQLALARENLAHLHADGNGDSHGGFSARGDRSLQLIQGDMHALTFAEGQFDLVAAFYSIIHLPRSEQTAMFQRIARWLRPGGVFVANFAAEPLEAAIIDKWLDRDEGWMFWSAWGAEKALEEIEKAGLEVVVKDVIKDVVDHAFLWVVAKKG